MSAVSENLKEATRAKNLPDVRGSLWSCLVFDMSMSGMYQESLNYVLANGISADELYEADDAADFDTNPTEANFDKIVGLLKVNFSFRKLEALRQIGATLVSPKRPQRRVYGKDLGSEVPLRRGRFQAGGNSGNPHSKAIAITTAAIAIAILVAGAYGIWRIIR